MKLRLFSYRIALGKDYNKKVIGSNSEQLFFIGELWNDWTY